METPACRPWSKDDPTLLWHSTPIKKRNDGAPPDHVSASGLTGFRMDGCTVEGAAAPNPSAGPWFNPSSPNTESPVKDLSSSTIQRLRKELQLLVAELKNREQELDAMMAAHRRQQRCWEEDRQRMERRRVRVEEELQRRNEMIRALTSRLCAAERREADAQKLLRDARQQEEPRVSREQWLHVQEQNQSLNSSVAALSTRLDVLQVQEEELTSMLKLKDKNMSDASSHIIHLSERLQELETSLKEKRCQEDKLQRDSEEERRRCRDARQEVAHLREELQQQVTQSSSQREEIIRLKQELQLLLTEGGDSWKDELLQLARSKQERLASELHWLRQVCETQQSDLQQLRLKEEKSDQELLRSQEQLLCRCVKLQNHRTSCSDPSPPTEALRFSTLSDDDGALSCCSPQKLLDESRLLADVSSLRRSMTSDPCVFHAAASTQSQLCEAPPRSCSRHSACQQGTSPSRA